MRRTLIALLGVSLLVLGVVGGASANLASAPQGSKIAKACVNGHKVLSLKVNGRCPGARHAVTIPTVGGPGQVLGYAHLLSDGTLDASRSWKVGAGNVVTTGNGHWCFKGLKFSPTGGQVTLDYNGILNGQVPVALIKAPTTPSSCGLSSAQFQVFTGLVDTSSFSYTSGETLGFYIVFY